MVAKRIVEFVRFGWFVGLNQFVGRNRFGWFVQGGRVVGVGVGFVGHESIIECGPLVRYRVCPGAAPETPSTASGASQGRPLMRTGRLQ